MESAIRMTKRRRLILDIVREHGHLDAYEVLERARKKDSRISLATVYRALAYFRERDMVHGRSFGEGHSHFELHDRAAGSHAHFICTGCGSVRETTGAFIRDMEERARRDHFLITSAHIDLFGLCEACSGKKS